MKCYTQVYVMDSMAAADTYCRAFGAQVTRAFLNDAQNAYAHCELSVQGEPILALAEALRPYDVSVIHRLQWQTMTFNAFELGSREAVETALTVLREGGVVLEELHKEPWNPCCATVIDRYGVCWWIAI